MGCRFCAGSGGNPERPSGKGSWRSPEFLVGGLGDRSSGGDCLFPNHAPGIRLEGIIFCRHTAGLVHFLYPALSSGTGSTGAGAAAILRKVATSPVTIQTPAGESLQLRRDDSVYLTGPAEIIGAGEFYV